MLYLFYGNDMKANARDRDRLLADISDKEDVSSVIARNDIDINVVELDALSASTELFGGTLVVVLEYVMENKDLRDSIIDKLPLLRESPNHFIFSERAVLAEPLRKFKASAESVKENVLKEAKAERANPFAISDALGSRDKKKTWAFYVEAIEKGSAPEEIAGILFWAVKNMILAKRAGRSGAESTGLNPFVFKKALASSNNFKIEELEMLSAGLVSAYHKGHSGEADMGLALESLILQKL